MVGTSLGPCSIESCWSKYIFGIVTPTIRGQFTQLNIKTKEPGVSKSLENPVPK